MTISKPVWRAFALLVAAGFFFLALRTDFDHATSPRSITNFLFGPERVHFTHPWWVSPHLWARKSYSVVAFTIVGFTANRALPATGRPRLRAAVLVGAYSLGIEIAQHFLVWAEPVVESAFDVGCGILGGWLAIIIDRAISRTALVREAAPNAQRTPGIRPGENT